MTTSGPVADDGGGWPPFRYSAITERPHITYPKNARVALWVALNLEVYDWGEAVPSISGGNGSSVRDYGRWMYGLRVGVWRLAELLERSGMSPSVIVNSDFCREYPSIVELGRRKGWVWIAHGKRNSIRQHDVAEEEEPAYLQEVLEDVARSTGHAPAGWFGPGYTEGRRTLEHLAALGVQYSCDWCVDDEPIKAVTPAGPITLIPYTVDLNDVPLRDRLTAAEYAGMVVDNFEVLYAEGAERPRVMAISLHPFVSGQAYRIAHIESALKHIVSHQNVWRTTSEALAEWYSRRHASRPAGGQTASGSELH